MILNPAIGAVDVWAIIPADLNAGESFYDKNLGDIPIEGSEQKAFGGDNRDTTTYNSTERFKRWDKVTGVFLEGTDKLETYTLTAIFDKTNIWSSQETAQLPLLWVLAGALVLVLVALVFLIRRTHRRR
jgi:hypothetical protein